jgi:hypothetical protein
MEKKMDKIGIYCSSVNTDLWINLYNMLKCNSTEIEVMFVGPDYPNFDLPPGMKYIHSLVKPVQCYYIGATRVDGNYTINMPDDVSPSPGCLDKCLELMKLKDQTKTIVTPRFVCAGNSLHRMDFYGDGIEGPNGTYPQVPNLAVGNLCSRELWNELGFDRNFVIGYNDVDQCMRLWAKGGQVSICEDVTLTVGLVVSHSSTASYNRFEDLKYFYSLWIKGPLGPKYQFGVPADKKTRDSDPRWAPGLDRHRPFEPIVESPDILTVSQGNKGRWN